MIETSTQLALPAAKEDVCTLSIRPLDPGEWLWQIARCYGADPKQVVLANPQLPNPAQILPGITVSVPNIGAGGRTIYGPPCVGTHTVQSGETWTSIAQLYNADVLVLQDVNQGVLSTGRVLKIPLNSAGNP